MSIKIYILINYIIDYMINIIKNYNDISIKQNYVYNFIYIYKNMWIQNISDYFNNYIKYGNI